MYRIYRLDTLAQSAPVWIHVIDGDWERCQTALRSMALRGITGKVVLADGSARTHRA